MKNFPKAIHYFTRCMEIQADIIKVSNYKENSLLTVKNFNKCRYRSSNDLGLIFLNKDLKKAEEYLKFAGLNEYPFGQNNYGLFSQFYLNKIENAIYLYEKASKHHFALSEYNLGYIEESNGNIEKSIEYYLKASEHEDKPLIFHDAEHVDKRLNISKIFIICYTNLKLTNYYFSTLDDTNARKFFIKSFEKLKCFSEKSSYKFQFRFKYENDKNAFSYLKQFILNFPLFNLKNQPDLQINMSEFETNDKNCTSNNEKSKDNKNINESKYNKFQKNKLSKYSEHIQNKEIEFESPEELFDFVIDNNKLKITIIDEIKEIIEIMKDILYTQPYSILFGRITIGKKVKEEISFQARDINSQFYVGFGIDLT